MSVAPHIAFHTHILNQRVAKLIDGEVVEKYLWANLTTLLAVYDAEDTLVQRFAYAGGRMPVAMTNFRVRCLPTTPIGEKTMIKKPEAVLEAALKHYENFEYEASLKNYQWFFNNAVDIDSTFIGAKYRMLKEWYCLAKDYKPAYDALVEQKNKSLNIFNDKHDLTSLSEYAKICHILNLDKEFIELFSHLCNTNMHLAKLAYIPLENILIKNKQWELCNLCIDDSTKNYQKIVEKFNELLRISNGAFHGEYNEIYKKQFEKDIQNLLWILKVGKREKEIEYILSELTHDLEKMGIDYSLSSPTSTMPSTKE